MITFIFGDSITLGLWDSQGGWADQLKCNLLDQEATNGIAHYHYAYNLGVDGNTTQQVLDRFDSEVQARLWEGKQYAFIFAVGINDTLYREQQFASTPDKYHRQLNLLYQKARTYSSHICFLDLNPVDEALTQPVTGSTTGKCYSNARIDAFNSVLHQFCLNHSVDLIRINHLFRTQDPRNLLIDGLHPNHLGHRLIYREVLPTLKHYINPQKHD